MADDDWYRRTEWTESDREAFLVRLKRSRTRYDKAQYLRIQAGYLGAIHPSAALELLHMVVEEFPEPGQLAQAHLQIALCRLRLGDPDAALAEFRRALEQESSYPQALTNAFLDFATFAIARERRDLYEEVARVLREREKRLLFPVDHYRFHAALAVVTEAAGDARDAALHARLALATAELKHSGFRYHPAVGLVGEQDEALQRRLTTLARLG